MTKEKRDAPQCAVKNASATMAKTRRCGGHEKTLPSSMAHGEVLSLQGQTMEPGVVIIAMLQKKRLKKSAL